MSAAWPFLFGVAGILLLARLAGALSARLRLPVVLGELLAGLILGPTVLNLWASSWLAPARAPGGVSAQAAFKLLALVGVILLMFLAGLDTDVALMRSALAPAFWAAAGGVVLPMTGGALLARAFRFTWPEALFIGTILTATSVTITAATLRNLEQLRSLAGSTILGAAVIDDVLGLIVLSLVIALTPRSAGAAIAWQALGWSLGKMSMFLVALLWWGLPLTRWVMGRAARLRQRHPAEVIVALTLAFLLAFGAQRLAGMAAITGAYLAGLFVAATPARENVAASLGPWVHSFFGPIFFVSIGLQVNARHLTGGIGFFVLLLLVAIAGKILGCGWGARVSGFSRRQALVVGLGMVPRGEVGLITSALGFAAGLVSQNVYAQMVMLVLLTTLLTPALLRFAFPGAPLDSSIDDLGTVEIGAGAPRLRWSRLFGL